MNLVGIESGLTLRQHRCPAIRAVSGEVCDDLALGAARSFK